MKTKTILGTGLAVATGLAIAGWIIFHQPPAQESARAGTKPPKNPARPAVTPEPAPDTLPAEQPGNFSENGTPRPEAKPDAAPKVAPQAVPTKKPKRPLQDPDARAAMSRVGADPEAEAYWLGAIFDSSLPDQEREDLIEDLNEEGLSDRKQPGPEDFPLIMNRIAIIEEIAPHADDFMLPHLAEAYKDLWNLAARTQGGGEPVR